MSKSQAIDAIMKIFLMIAVIIVGMSFLMKAFGIDIFGWLEEKFADFGIPNSGDALHVTLDPHNIGEDKVKVFGFFLTSNTNEPVLIDDGSFTNFLIENFPSLQCTIFIETDRTHKYNEGEIIYVAPGSRIQDDLPNILSGLIDPDIGCKRVAVKSPPGCETHKKCNAYTDPNKVWIAAPPPPPPPWDETNVPCRGKFNIGDCKSAVVDFYCDGKQGDKVINKNFEITTEWACKERNCNLLQTKDKLYKVRYGIICDDGKWKVCKKDAKEPKVSGDLFTATCDWNGARGVWGVQPTVQTYPLHVGADGKQGYIKYWLIYKTPFSESGCACQEAPTCQKFLNEPNVGDPAPGDAWVVVRDRDDGNDDGLIDLTSRLGNNKVTYAVAYVYSYVDQTVHLWFRDDDGIQIWADNELKVDIPNGDDSRLPEVQCEGLASDPESSSLINLKTGENKILIRIGNNVGNSGFSIRLTKDIIGDQPAEGVKVYLKESL